ncbi:MAG: hypothetical protein BGO96_04605 [Micrococcales bacterium 73-15]|uniref:phage portal protein n=1 Tax=Salana multivorans TaxID=120377 RepID=UPI00095C7911|nr:phage portal protein [Salana multivorans]OJX98663.1 MAG: hypothetical protein BGO96_04605 [Micrococcales bacterium 73-15]
MTEWDAWYVGDPAGLQATYSNSVDRPRTRPSQYRGGLVGAVSRFFWGRPIHAGQARTRLHVPVPADLATTSADLLFSEPPRIVLPGDAQDASRKPAQDRLEKIMNTPENHAGLLEAAELAAALGGTYLRIVWDTEGPPMPFLTAVHADGAIPTWKWGRLASVVFWTIVHRDGQQVWRHVESHEPGRILHGLYLGTSDNLGRLIPLTEHTATEWAANLVDADGAIITGVTGMTAGYVPNVRPSRRWRTEPELSPLGRSDFEGLEGLFDALDETYSSWMRDVRLAKARLLVDQNTLTPLGEGQGAVFDTDQELFTSIPGVMGSMKDGNIAQAEQFDIRTAEHRDTAVELIKAILRGAGYSPQTFGDDAMVVSTTATEVKARERLSERTRDKKARYWASTLGPLSRTMLDIDALVFGGKGAGVDIPEVRFPPKAQEDTLELAQTVVALRNAEAASIETRVRMVHPEWDGGTVNDEVERIQAETRLADPATLRPGVDDGGDERAVTDFGTLVRSGATQDSAARVTGLTGLEFTGERPVTTRPAEAGE